MDDPIAELVEALESQGEPAAEWLGRWAADGTLRAAWAASRDAGAMLALLALAWGDDLAEEALRAARPRAALSGGEVDAEVLREVAAEPPALADLWAERD